MDFATAKSSKPGLALAQTGILDEQHQRIMAALSVTTVDELYGLLGSEDPAVDVLSQLMEGTDLPRLSEEVAQIIGDPARLDFEEGLLREEYGLGAQPPAAPLLEEPAELYMEPDRAGVGLEYGVTPCLGPIRDQGGRGTCVAHAIAALRECLHHRATGQVVDLSEQFSYWCCKRTDGFPATSGTWLRVAAYALVRDGICPEPDWPYAPQLVPGNEGQGPPPPGAVAAGLPFITGRAIALPPRSVPSIQRALQEGWPVAVSIPVFPTWLRNPEVRRTGEIIMPLPTSRAVGGHAMLIVGCHLDPAYAGAGFFVVRNSWGARWATQGRFGVGYGTLPFNYVAHYGWEAYTADLW